MNTVHSNLVIGQNIKTLREKMGLTQEALAQYLHSSRENIHYYETGQKAIPSAQLNQLAHLFCVDEYDFYKAAMQEKILLPAFAYRAEDHETLSRFTKIVFNYLHMKKAMADE